VSRAPTITTVFGIDAPSKYKVLLVHELDKLVEIDSYKYFNGEEV
jgi:hypothetical protein